VSSRILLHFDGVPNFPPQGKKKTTAHRQHSHYEPGLTGIPKYLFLFWLLKGAVNKSFGLQQQYCNMQEQEFKNKKNLYSY